MRINVVVPLHNNEQTIERALKSILSQSFRPDKIVVVDDCSSDKGADVVEKICKEEKIVELIRCKEKQGAQGARNVGIKAFDDIDDIENDWVAFLDADDEWVSNKLELQVSEIERNPDCILVFGDGIVIDKNGIRDKKCGKTRICNSENFINCTVMFQAMIVKRKSLIEIGYLDEKVPAYQEWDTAMRLIPNHKFVYIDKPLFKYYLDTGEHISSSRKKSLNGFEYIVLKNRRILMDSCKLNVVRLYFEGMIARCNSDAERVKYSLLFLLYRLCPLREFKTQAAIGLMQRRLNRKYM